MVSPALRMLYRMVYAVPPALVSAARGALSVRLPEFSPDCIAQEARRRAESESAMNFFMGYLTLRPAG